MEIYYKISSIENFKVSEIPESEGNLTYIKVYLIMFYKKINYGKTKTELIFTIDFNKSECAIILLYSNEKSIKNILNCLTVAERFISEKKIFILKANVLNLSLQKIMSRFGWEEIKKGNLKDKKYQKKIINFNNNI